MIFQVNQMFIKKKNLYQKVKNFVIKTSPIKE
jgi:hypothetical protein